MHICTIFDFFKGLLSSRAEKISKQRNIKEEKQIMEKNDKLFEIKGNIISNVFFIPLIKKSYFTLKMR